MGKTTLKILGFTEEIPQEQISWAVNQLEKCGCRITTIEKAPNFHVAITYLLIVT